MIFCGCVNESDPRNDLSLLLGSIFVNDVNESQIADIVEAVSEMGNCNKKSANDILENLLRSVHGIPLSEVFIKCSDIKSKYYRGLFLNDIRDARIALANIDKIKDDGFGTVWIGV